MSTARTVAPILTPGVRPAEVIGAEPIFEWVDPRKLLVDERYQRDLTERSITLIRKIVGNWSWTKMKPPIVVETELGMEVIDGQHTAIAAASHPGVRKIPVMIVEAEHLADRAGAFLGHNADRIAVTPLQMHHAAVLAGDEMAQTIDQVCQRAGVHLLKANPGGSYKPGDCVALSTIRGVINRRGALGARRVLEVCVQGRKTPIGMADIRATEILLFDPAEADRFEGPDITSAMLLLGQRAEQQAKSYAASHGVRMYEAMAAVLRRRVEGYDRRRAG